MSLDGAKEWEEEKVKKKKSKIERKREKGLKGCPIYPHIVATPTPYVHPPSQSGFDMNEMNKEFADENGQLAETTLNKFKSLSIFKQSFQPI